MSSLPSYNIDAGPNIIGSLLSNTKTITAATYNIVPTDDVIFIDTTAALVNINLPAASASNRRSLTFIKIAGGNRWTITPATGDKIGTGSTSTAATFSSANGSHFYLIADGGTIWWPRNIRDMFAYRMFLAGTQSLTSGTEAAITFDTTDFAVGGISASSNPTLNFDGIFQIEAGASFAANATGFRQLTVYQDANILSQSKTVNNGAGDAVVLGCSAQLGRTSAGPVITVKALQNSGGALNVGGARSTYLSISWINEAFLT